MSINVVKYYNWTVLLQFMCAMNEAKKEYSVNPNLMLTVNSGFDCELRWYLNDTQVTADLVCPKSAILVRMLSL